MPSSHDTGPAAARAAGDAMRAFAPADDVVDPVDAALPRALADGELQLAYQPQLSLQDGRIVGAEVLLRWTSPALGRIEADRIVARAEALGLGVALGNHVLQAACRQGAAWRRAGHAGLRLAVNVSPGQLLEGDFVGRLLQALGSSGLPADGLALELTEAALVADDGTLAPLLGRLKALGVSIGLDDFGSGYSSLHRLRLLPIDVLKIDRAFTADITAGARNASVTRAILQMAHSLQMRVVAEGVETAEQLGMLVASGCDAMQGYWFSPPVPAAAMQEMLELGRRLPERYTRPPQPERTLLLVAGPAPALSALRRLFRRDGYRILAAPDAGQGRALLEQHRVDVVVAALAPCDASGTELLRLARRLQPEAVRLALADPAGLTSALDALDDGTGSAVLLSTWGDERLREHVAWAFRQRQQAHENRRLQQALAGTQADLARATERLARLLAGQREQSALLAARARGLDELLEGLPVPLLGVDADGSLCVANRQARQQLPGVACRLGEPPIAPLRQAWAAPAGGAPHVVALGGRRWSVVVQRALPGQGGPRGGLMAFTSADDAARAGAAHEPTMLDGTHG